MLFDFRHFICFFNKININTNSRKYLQNAINEHSAKGQKRPSFTLIDHPGKPNQSAKNHVDPWGLHYQAESASIAFGSKRVSPPHHGPGEITTAPGAFRTFATCGESRNEMKGCADWKNGNWKKSTAFDRYMDHLGWECHLGYN